ncbi:iron chelate uptake ABC transporter family permease subunit [Parasphaerochaeta coccoides]|uniref:Transport system permease protein n=1 Tax=Parasphaerochaeta coccoides (strain ATCC BAA-1237 / DSM 17374 / SPN1) TaxID=760011 RepID=F4GL03_PARC1|nr:iron chelate uptake ABC transporter family permease subunit [Parasphaerochaeta coccoides]AEC02343.1 transport system permease protein [Parasphaerochaeta coccoides DSM 17374]
MAKRNATLIHAILIPSLLMITTLLVFLLWGISPDAWGFILPRRAVKLAAICIVGASTAVATLVFQTVNGNKILTPSVMGLDSLYLFLQTFVVFFFGSHTLAMMSDNVDFLISVILMGGAGMLLYAFSFRGENSTLLHTVLTGIILGFLFNGLATFMQVLIDPNEFLVVQARLVASFNQVNTALLGLSAIILTICLIYILRKSDVLDVMALGRDVAKNLGVEFEKEARAFMFLIAIMVAVSTALVGPVAFFGLLVVSLARHISGTYKHAVNASLASILAIIALVGGQFMVERLFLFSVPISVIINFAGGLYFLRLLLKEGL